MTYAAAVGATCLLVVGCSGANVDLSVSVQSCDSNSVVLGTMTIANHGSAAATYHDPTFFRGGRILDATMSVLRDVPVVTTQVDTQVRGSVTVQPGQSWTSGQITLWDGRLDQSVAPPGVYGIVLVLPDGTTSQPAWVALPSCVPCADAACSAARGG